MSTATMTGPTMTHDGSAAASRIGGIAGFAVRVGRALERWGERIAQPPTRDEQLMRIAIEREGRLAIAARGDAHAGAYQLLR